MNVVDFSNYVVESEPWLLKQLTRVVSELYNAYVIYGTTQGQERSARIRGFLQSSETTVAGRERDAEAHALHLTVELHRMQAQIKALSEERDLLLVLLRTEIPRDLAT
jgi:hypothetical protein